MKKRIDLVFGGQAGSEGKGKVAGYMALRHDYRLAICDFAPNAGHTWRSGECRVVVSQVPVSHISDGLRLAIAPGSILNVDNLLSEIEKFGLWDRIAVDPRAMVVMQHHREAEAELLKRISSTCKGAGAALSEKVMRLPGLVLARDVPALSRFISPVVDEIAKCDGDILVEGAQGFDLDIDFGLQYPHCTSRHTTPAAIMSRCGINPRQIRDCIAVIRTYPIRVGNVVEDGVQVGYSGDYAGSSELAFETIADRAGMSEVPQEITTVTGKPRRIFEFNMARFRMMMQMTGANRVALMFADYLNDAIFGASSPDSLSMQGVSEFIDNMKPTLTACDAQLSHVGTGPDDFHMVVPRCY